MPVKEESFRNGCGRYIQGKGYISRLYDEVSRLGSRPLIIGGPTALSLTEPAIVNSLDGKCGGYRIVKHLGTCCDDDAKELAATALSDGFDVIVGVGGGVIMDFAKLCGHFASLPIINVPTSSATCAAYTPLSVRYTPEGRTVGTLHFDREINAVIADTEILVRQPIRLLLAGVFDALAKFVEIKQRYKEDDDSCPLGLDYAYAMSKRSFDLLTKKTERCIADMEKGEVTDTVDSVIFTTIAATGVISSIARGSNQCAIAHKFYETTRKLYPEASKPYLHGEIVGVGLIIQNFFNGECGNNSLLFELMKRHSMPMTLSDIGIAADERTLKSYYDIICTTSAVDADDDDMCRRFHSSLEYLWEM